MDFIFRVRGFMKGFFFFMKNFKKIKVIILVF